MIRNKIISIVLIICFAMSMPLAAATEKYVGIFYACWANECLGTTYGDDVYIMGQTPYSPYPAWNWWGKPLYAATHGDSTIKNNYKLYFDSPDHPNNDLIDWHAELLDSAGVNYITLDLTNGIQTNIVNGAKAICKRYQERMQQSLSTPQIVFWVQDSVCLHTVESEIFNIYDSSIFFEYLGKKLVNVAGGNVQPAIPDQGIFGRYTCRRMWGLNTSGNFWQFKVNASTPPPPFMYNGEAEQMCAPVATQATYMTTDGIHACTGAVGRQNGAYFIKYMEAAIAADVKFVFIHSWNEWCAQNFGTPSAPVFTDLWKKEYSADIEPMDGGHGWQYYTLMCEKIAEFKDTTISACPETGSAVPGDFQLEQNSPNPFNPDTVIRYGIPKFSNVNLTIYDIKGRVVETLVDQQQGAGYYLIDLDASEYVSGLYIYCLKAGDVMQTKKMLLLK